MSYGNLNELSLRQGVGKACILLCGRHVGVDPDDNQSRTQNKLSTEVLCGGKERERERRVTCFFLTETKWS